MYVDGAPKSCYFLIDIQLCRQCSSVWRILQAVGKARLLGRLHKSSHLNYCQLQGLTYFQVAGHAEDEHLCSAPLHMCGKVRYQGGGSVFHLLTRDIGSRAPSKG
jgi:hypothetical protein